MREARKGLRVLPPSADRTAPCRSEPQRCSAARCPRARRAAPPPAAPRSCGGSPLPSRVAAARLPAWRPSCAEAPWDAGSAATLTRGGSAWDAGAAVRLICGERGATRQCVFVQEVVRPGRCQRQRLVRTARKRCLRCDRRARPSRAAPPAGAAGQRCCSVTSSRAGRLCRCSAAALSVLRSGGEAGGPAPRAHPWVAELLRSRCCAAGCSSVYTWCYG